MQKENSGFWRFQDNNLPGWITATEDKLHEVIQEELQKQSVA
jgi:tRNA U34 5-carboxymethylaminomethyl modifying enzyme MnmG/GidA